MVKHFFIVISLLLFCSLATNAQEKGKESLAMVKTSKGVLEGVVESGIRIYRGIPFAEPPVGDLRWKEPVPVKPWQGIRKADKFGPSAMQVAIFGDMNFRSETNSEDCLYLNVWTPAKTNNEKLPVLVYFHGGGFVAGSGSEPRYDGESMARNGIVSVTVNYRMGVFGFMAHPELTKESKHNASGNYGLLDQVEALRWVKENIAFFGGDPTKVTIAGESAGSVSVSALMASPLSKDLIAGAIGESGSLLGTLPAMPLQMAEKGGEDFGKSLDAKSISELRAIPAEKLMQSAMKFGAFRFSMAIDGYLFPKSPYAIYEAGEQAKVPLLVGWNSEEMNKGMILGMSAPTKENFESAIKKIYNDDAEEVLKLYNGKTEDEIAQAATDLAGDRFIAFSTWKWSDLHSLTGSKPVYRYYYAHPRPAMRPEFGNATPGLAGGINKSTDTTAKPIVVKQGAVHSAEIEYCMGNLGTNRIYDWQPTDYKVSEVMQHLFINFIKNGNPNQIGSPEWLPIKAGNPAPIMVIDVHTRLEQETEAHHARYQLMEKLAKKALQKK